MLVAGGLAALVALTGSSDEDLVIYTARLHYGEEAQDPEAFDKQALCFLSGEDLPRCWTDPASRTTPNRGTCSPRGSPVRRR